MAKQRRNEPNHPPATSVQRDPPPARATPQPLDCTKCEGTGATRTARAERDEDGGFAGAEVVTCKVCGGTGKEPAK